MSIRWFTGDCRETLRTLAPGSVQSAITSPPYYGLRDYGLPPLVWGGDAEHAHIFAEVSKYAGGGQPSEKQRWQHTGLGPSGHPRITTGLCSCGSWFGSLGLEPTPELYVQHLVEVFREVRRVLRDDGTLWLNLGDSYAGSGNGSNDHWQNGKHFRKGIDSFSLNAEKYQGQKPGHVPNLADKNLMLMPARVAMALQADGWTLRSQIPWLKRNSMPESTDDRPSTSVEYVYLLSKSNSTTFWTHRDLPGTRARPAPDYRWVHRQTREEVSVDPSDPEQWPRVNLWRGRDYFWDADAVRMNGPDWGSRDRTNGVTRDDSYRANGHPAHRGLEQVVAGRSLRNADFFFQTWQGLLLDEQDEPLALVVNPAPFKESHFATFPPKLVEPMVKASTSERGQCPECGAPWVGYNTGGGKTLHEVPFDASVDDVRERFAEDFGAAFPLPEVRRGTETGTSTGESGTRQADRESVSRLASGGNSGAQTGISAESRGKTPDAGRLEALRTDRAWEVATSEETTPLGNNAGWSAERASSGKSAASAADGSRGSVPSDGLDCDIESAEQSLLLLPLEVHEDTVADDGSCNPIVDRREAQPRKHRGSMPTVQLEKTQQVALTGLAPKASATPRNDGSLPQTTGWRPSCAHTEPAPIPQTILDPFAGSGTVGLVADRLGRNAILCELSDKYGEMGKSRVVGDAPMFVEFEDA